MKKAFWLLAAGAMLSALLAASLGRAADEPQVEERGGAD
jgi:hypothetical protein